jgi:hypothetical protein
MGNSREPSLDLLHGVINYTHTTNLTPFYPSGNLPTPYPIIILSVIVSFVISCYSFKSAMLSVTALKSTVSGVRDHPRSPWARKASLRERPINDTELEDLHKKEAPGVERTDRTEGLDPPPPYMADAGPVFEEPPLQPQLFMTSALPGEAVEIPKEARPDAKWPESRSRRIAGTILIIYSTFRAATAIIVTIQGLINKTTSAPSPSNLLLILVSIQINAANYSIPRLLRMVLTLDIVLISTAFVITSFTSFSKSTRYPAYAHLALAGGTCPFYSSNCYSQYTHWDVVGCGNYSTVSTSQNDGEDDDDYTTPSGFLQPYGTNGSLNGSMSPLNTVEAISVVCGLIWMATAIFQVYEGRYLVKPRKENRRAQYINGRDKQPSGVSLISVTVLLGIIGAFVGSLM